MTKKSAASLANSRIDHYEYGTGTVVDANERYTTIDFDEAGPKKFVTSIVKLTPSDTPAPTKPRRKKAAKKKAKAKTTKAKATKAKTTKAKATKAKATKAKTTKAKTTKAKKTKASE